MIRQLSSIDVRAIHRVINEAAQVYKGVIPRDRWREPYMPLEELCEEMVAGVKFYGWVEKNTVVGVMGIQPINGTTLIRHSYVLPTYQRQGIGGRLLEYLITLSDTPEILVGTWEDATWAIRFYEKHGFQLVSSLEKTRLLHTYWTIPERQIATSVVLLLACPTGTGTTVELSERDPSDAFTLA